MVRYTIRRLFWALVALFGISLITFALTYFMPGDPARRVAGIGASAATVRSIRHQLGLDQPFWVQYGRYLGDALHGNFGYSYTLNVPVLPAILARFPITAQLAVGGVIVELIIGLPTGIIAAYKRGSVADRIATLIALLGLSAPTFWLGLMLLYYIAFKLGALPIGGYGSPAIEYLILPSFTLGIGGAAVYTRTFRSTILDVLDQPYIQMARSKGLPEAAVLFRHVIPNAIIPIVTQIGIDLGYFLGGVFIVEAVFGLPGIGQQAIEAIQQLDIPIIMGTVLFAALLIVLSNIVVDLTFALIDPRIRYR
ncbi:MAG TPA: ABC transporter permease [Chloroflexota bacterium]|nr:ABC transporter permease [Chloroflexota bacterium]